MKKVFLSFALLAAFIGRSKAYTVVTVQDSISTDTHWTCDQQYLLKGYVYVTAGATLTIDPGCIIRGDKDTKGALIIERGAKIKAMGSATNPIVFTSNQEAGSRAYGDWGGVILCGKAPVNWNAGQAQVEGGPRSFYGGTEANDNSGEMHYVRVEFGGIAFSPNNEVNGLTFCGVGSATQVDHIQVSYSGDDSYEWFGGTVNAKYLVSLAAWDDDFDTDNGYTGNNQFCVSVRDPFAADQSGSKAFESDSYQSGTATGLGGDTSKITKPVFSNCTIIGPLVSPTSTAYDPQFVAGAHIRRGSGISILNSIIAGWPAGVLIDESSASFGSTTGNIATGMLQFRNNIVCGNPTFASSSNPKDVVYVKDGARSLTSTAANADSVTGTPFAPFDGPLSWLNNPAYHNKTYITEQTGVRLSNPFTLTNPGLIPTSTSPVVYNAAHAFNPNLPINYDTTGSYANYNVPAFAPDFTNSKAAYSFFTKVNFVGAFAGTGTTSDNWMKGWCNFDPNNADYETTCYVAIPEGVATIKPGSFDGVKVFPNPASTEATVLLDVKNAGNISIHVIDVTGKIVKTVFNGTATTGVQSYNFNTADLSSGMYIVSISAAGKNKTVKLSIVK